MSLHRFQEIKRTFVFEYYAVKDPAANRTPPGQDLEDSDHRGHGEIEFQALYAGSGRAFIGRRGYGIVTGE